MGGGRLGGKRESIRGYIIRRNEVRQSCIQSSESYKLHNNSATNAASTIQESNGAIDYTAARR